MTDTAVPMPEPKAPDETPLTGEQLQRVEALRVASSILAGKPSVFTGAKISDARAVWEITTLADWILNGSPANEGDTIQVVDDRGNVVREISTRLRDSETDSDFDDADDVDDGI